MNKSSRKAKPPLEDVWGRRDKLLKILLDNTPLLVGTVYETLRRCGNPTCRCAKRPTHRQTLLIFTRKGRRLCRFVRQARSAEMHKAAQRYRLCRKALREFQTLQNRERRLLKVQIRKRAIPLM